MDTPTTTRRVDLDWIRIAAFGVLIVYHVGMYYVSWDWHVKSPHAGTTIEPLMMLSSPWRLSLLFFVSGTAASFALARGHAGFAGARSRRLLIPLVFGMLVIVVPQVNPARVTPLSEAFQAVIWHCLVSHPALQVKRTKW